MLIAVKLMSITIRTRTDIAPFHLSKKALTVVGAVCMGLEFLCVAIVTPTCPIIAVLTDTLIRRQATSPSNRDGPHPPSRMLYLDHGSSGRLSDVDGISSQPDSLCIDLEPTSCSSSTNDFCGGLKESGEDDKKKTEKYNWNYDDDNAWPLEGNFCEPPSQPGAVLVQSLGGKDDNKDGYSFEEPQKGTAKRTMPSIEIAPGVFKRLRSAEETWRCIERDFYMPCACFTCQQDLFCIQDASYVLCPVCQTVSPMEGIDPNHNGGVGIGFQMEYLARCQNEFLAKRKNAFVGGMADWRLLMHNTGTHK